MSRLLRIAVFPLFLLLAALVGLIFAGACARAVYEAVHR
jgi:hypothetical protein